MLDVRSLIITLLIIIGLIFVESAVIRDEPSDYSGIDCSILEDCTTTACVKLLVNFYKLDCFPEAKKSFGDKRGGLNNLKKILRGSYMRPF